MQMAECSYLLGRLSFFLTGPLEDDEYPPDPPQGSTVGSARNGIAHARPHGGTGPWRSLVLCRYSSANGRCGVDDFFLVEGQRRELWTGQRASSRSAAT